MTSRSGRTRQIRRDRRLAKASGFKRAPLSKNGKVGHGAGKHQYQPGDSHTDTVIIEKRINEHKWPVLGQAFKDAGVEL